jgi:CRISPR-associated protein Cmr5
MNNTRNVQTMDQQRAAFALQTIEGFLLKQDKTRQTELRRYIIQIPALIHMNGLGQALAFYRMKGRDSSHELIYQLLGKWLCQDKAGRVFDGTEHDLLKAITGSDYRCYMAAQNEALALLEWLKKFATALLHKED